MMKILILIVIFLLSAGCASTLKVTTPGGRPGYHLNCWSEEQCYKKVSDLCPTGYNVLSAHEEINQMTFDGGKTYTPVRSIKMFIECAPFRNSNWKLSLVEGQYAASTSFNEDNKTASILLIRTDKCMEELRVVVNIGKAPTEDRQMEFTGHIQVDDKSVNKITGVAKSKIGQTSAIFYFNIENAKDFYHKMHEGKIIKFTINPLALEGEPINAKFSLNGFIEANQEALKSCQKHEK